MGGSSAHLRTQWGPQGDPYSLYAFSQSHFQRAALIHTSEPTDGFSKSCQSHENPTAIPPVGSTKQGPLGHMACVPVPKQVINVFKLTRIYNTSQGFLRLICSTQQLHSLRRQSPQLLHIQMTQPVRKPLTYEASCPGTECLLQKSAQISQNRVVHKDAPAGRQKQPSRTPPTGSSTVSCPVFEKRNRTMTSDQYKTRTEARIDWPQSDCCRRQPPLSASVGGYESIKAGLVLCAMG